MQEYILHADCHPTKYSAMYQSRRSAGRLSEPPLYIFWGTMVTFEQRRCISSVVLFASFNCLPRYYWFLLVMCRNLPTPVIIAAVLPDFTTCYLSTNRPQSHCWPTNCLRLCAWPASTDDLSVSIWMPSDADKIYSRSINGSFCIKWFTIVLFARASAHQSFVLVVLSFVWCATAWGFPVVFSFGLCMKTRFRSTSMWKTPPSKTFITVTERQLSDLLKGFPRKLSCVMVSNRLKNAG